MTRDKTRALRATMLPRDRSVDIVITRALWSAIVLTVLALATYLAL